MGFIVRAHFVNSAKVTLWVNLMGQCIILNGDAQRVESLHNIMWVFFALKSNYLLD